MKPSVLRSKNLLRYEMRQKKRCLLISWACRARKKYVYVNFLIMFRLTTLFMKEAEAEKASIMRQYEDAVSRRTAIDEEQRTFLEESNKVKGQIQNFEEAREGVGVRVTFEMSRL